MSSTPMSGPQPLTGRITLVSVSPWPEEWIREVVGPDTPQVQVKIEVAPPSPDADELRALLSRADLVIGDGRHKTKIDRGALESMARCRLIQQPAVGFDATTIARRPTVASRSRTPPATTATRSPTWS